MSLNIDIVESFALLGMSASRIDRMYHLSKGRSHDVIVGWWADCHANRPTHDAVTRWKKMMVRFVTSDKVEDDVPLLGESPMRVRMLLEGTKKFLDSDLAYQVNVVEDCGRVYLRRRL